DRSLPTVYPRCLRLPGGGADENALTHWLEISLRRRRDPRGRFDFPELALGALLASLRKSLRKEVIQPQVLLRLPCYDLVPVTELAVGAAETQRLRALPASMT